MNVIQKKRLIWIFLITCSVALAVALVLYALQQNINLFYSPSQIASGKAPINHEVRLGGLVQTGSVQRTPNSLRVSFVITDRVKQIRVNYIGILPDLFREGRSVVVAGKLNERGIMLADQVLAKHDEKYMPKEVAVMLRDKIK